MTSSSVGVKVALVASVDVLALLGNILLFVVLLRKPSFRTQTNAFILNLAAADVLVATLNMPLMIASLVHGDWMFDESVCKLSAFLSLLSFVASVMSLAMVSVNRYHFVVKWRTYQCHFSWRRSAVYIAVVWLWSAFLCAPPLLGWARYRFISDQAMCFVDWSASPSYMFSMAAVCLLGPATTMAFSYWRIWAFTSSSAKKLKSQGALEENSTSNKNNVHSAGPGIRGALELISSQVDKKHKEGVAGSVALSQVEIMEVKHDRAGNPLPATGPGRIGRNTERTVGEDIPTTHQQECSHTVQTPEPSLPSERPEKHTYPKMLKKRAGQGADAKLTRTLFMIVVAFCLCWTPYTVVCIVRASSSLPISAAAWFAVVWLGCANSVCNVLIYVSTSTHVRKEFLRIFQLQCLGLRPRNRLVIYKNN